MPDVFLDILPDPNIGITDAGFEGDTANPGMTGQAFASVKLTEDTQMKQDRTISGKLIRRSPRASRWLIDITYNPMTREQFDPVYNFLLQKRGSMTPFYVRLPQYAAPQDPKWEAHCISKGGYSESGGTLYAGGSTFIELWEYTAWTSNDYSVTGLPTSGDIFTLGDYYNDLTTKAYMVTHVETHDNYTTIPTNQCVRVHFTPPLQVEQGVNNKAWFINPLFYVVQRSDLVEYSLGNNNLYRFKLSLEEAFL